MFYYSTVGDIVTTHGALETDEYQTPCVRVRFERPNDKNGFDFAEGKIPHYSFQKTYGFSEDELFRLREYMRNNAFLIWEFAQHGGGQNA